MNQDIKDVCIHKLTWNKYKSEHIHSDDHSHNNILVPRLGSYSHHPTQVLVSSSVLVMIFTKVERSLTRFLQAWRPSLPSSQGQSTHRRLVLGGREGFSILEGLDDWFRILRSSVILRTG